MASSPLAAGQMLVGLDFYLGPVQEFAVVGDPATKEVQQVLQAIRSEFRPNKVLALKCTQPGTPSPGDRLPLLADRPAKGAVTTYLCQNFVCQEPLLGVEALRKALQKTAPPAMPSEGGREP
jgi:uncharacterized protein YyaL (SSP411 family)